MLQHVDRNVGPADYRHLREDQLLVTKVFGVTHQGEGPHVGTPAVFIRLAGCDKGDKVSCSWCDTFFEFGKGQVISTAELVADVQKKFAETYQMTCSQSPALVVLTGGEPMLQDNIVRLVEELDKAKFRIQVESNGDRLAKGFENSIAELVVSPKVIPSTKRYRRLADEVFARVDYLKFVVEADRASPYRELPPYVFEWCMRTQDPGRVFVSPITVYNRAVEPNEIASFWTDGLINKEETAANYIHAADISRKYGYRVSIQSHLYLGAE